MLGHIYYALGLLVLLSSLVMIIKFKSINSIREWATKFKSVTGKDPKKEDFRSSDEHELNTAFISLGVTEFIWVMGGLLTSSWYLFLSLLIYAIFINTIVSPIRFNIVGKLITLHYYILKFLVYLYLIINHFHLHYDTLGIIKSYI